MRTCAIVLDYRNATKTSKCLKSLIGQSLSTVYIVDNSASETCTRQLQSVVDTLSSATIDYKIIVIGANRNLGFANGVNFAIKTDLESSSPHDHYLLINNDATAHTGLVLRLQKALTNDNALLATPCISVPYSSPMCTIWYNRYLGLQTSEKTPLSFNFVIGCCMLFSNKLIKDNRLFDPAFFMYGEDAMLCWRLYRAGINFRVVEDAYVEHEFGASSHKSGLFYEYYITRGHVLMAVKAYNNPLEIPLMLTTKFISLSLRMLVRCIRYRSIIPAYAFILAWLPVKLRLTP